MVSIWTFESVEDLKASLIQAGLERYADRVAATARPCLSFLRRQMLDDELPLGVSKLGGDPDLPPDFA